MNDTPELLLSSDGIFPITRDASGNPLPVLPSTNLTVAGTLQGEGKLAGTPSLFIRLAGCNLHCQWTLPDSTPCPCDTAYASFAPRDTRSLPLPLIADTIRHNLGTIRHLVITGGEPLLQANPLTLLCDRLKHDTPDLHITLETNATLFHEPLARYIDLFSLSPKLASSTPPRDPRHATTRLNIPAIQAFIRHARLLNKDIQLKFVYASPDDTPEILSILSRLTGLLPGDILLMPLGTTPEHLRSLAPRILQLCLLHGWRYCDRLHVHLFGNRPGI